MNSTIMLRQFVLLWVLCAIAMALPQNKKLVETESTTLSTTTTSTTDPPLTTTTGVTTTTTVASPTVATSTAKPKSKVINIKHAADLTKAMSEAGDKLVVIFVMATWCGYSRRIEPTVEEVARSTDNLIVLKVVDNEVDTSEDWKYGVNGVTKVPTFSFWKEGTKLEEYASANAERLKQRIAENMSRTLDHNVILS